MSKIAIAGVKSGLGREFLNLLIENDYSPEDVVALEAKSPLGTLVSYGEDDELDVYSLDEYNFNDVDQKSTFC